MTDRYEDEHAIIWMEDGIVHFIYKENVIIDFQTQVKHVRYRNSISGEIPRPLFADTRGVKYWTKEAKTFSNTEEGTRLVAAVALIVSSSIQKISWNWAVKILKIKTPSRLFTINEKELAYKWLKHYKTA